MVMQARPAPGTVRYAACAAVAAAPATGKASVRAALAAAALAVAAIWATPAAPARASEAEAVSAIRSHRVITLAPHATEIVFAAGAGEQIVGTVSSSDYPSAARRLPRVGDGITLNREIIITLKPTLFIGWLRSAAALQVEGLAGRLDAGVVYFTPAKLRDIPAQVRLAGDMLGSTAYASKAAASMEDRIDALETRYSDRTTVPVFIEVGTLPLYTIGDDPLINDALRICAAVNIYASTGIPAPRVPIESVLIQQPGLIVAPARHDPASQDTLKRWTSYGLTAAARGHVHIADPDALFRPGPRLIDATEALCAAIDRARMDYP